MSHPDYFITDPDVLEGYASDWSGEVMVPEFLVRPKSLDDITEVVKYCAGKKIAITPAGAQSCDTAASLSTKGVCLSTNQMKSIIEINPDEGYAIAEPGILLGDLKRELREQNLFYAPDPTSENIATLGGTVATNASGARGYKYGSTADHILGLEVVLADGSVRTISSSNSIKHANGPAAFHREARMWVGSEGIFGVFSKIKIKITKGVPEAYALVCFFEDIDKLVQFAIDIRNNKYPKVSPRSLEYMDKSCLDLLKASGKFPQIPQAANGLIMLEQEHTEETLEETLDAWLEVLEEATSLAADTFVADTEAKINELREIRHHVPAHLNEQGAKAQLQGGRKVSTDWAVNLNKFPQMMKGGEEICKKFGFGPERTYRYAHLGDGHPHYNFIPANTQETEKCLEMRRELSKLAVSLGGTVAGEHGIGKHRKDLLALENPEFKLKIIRAIKNELDPLGIMAPGNIL